MVTFALLLPPLPIMQSTKKVSPQPTFNPQFQPHHYTLPAAKPASTAGPPALPLWDPLESGLHMGAKLVSATLYWEGDQGEQLRFREEKLQQRRKAAGKKKKTHTQKPHTWGKEVYSCLKLKEPRLWSRLLFFCFASNY